MDFEIKPLRKYTIECPMCADSRSKRGSKTLTVYRDPDGYIRWECSHAGQCAWNERQWAVDDHTEDLKDSMIESTLKPIKIVGGLPTHLDGNPIWWYKSLDGKEVLYGSMRKDKTDGKSYHPVTLQEDSTVRQLPNWPSVKGFYGQERIAQSDKVLVVEGEKAADAGQKLFPKTAVLSIRGGASDVGSGDFSLLRGKTVYIWPDNDKPGLQWVQKIISKLEDNLVYQVDVSWVPINAKGKGGDLADGLDMKLVNKALKEAKLVHKPIEIYSTLDSIRESAQKRHGRYLTGWLEVDDRVKFPMSGMVVVEGRTGHGKTAFAANLAYNAGLLGKQVYYFSFEVPEDEIIARLSRVGNPALDLDDILENMEQYASGLNLEALKITDPSKRLNSQKLQQILNNPNMNGTVVIIDYAQKIPTSKVDIRQGLVDFTDQMELLAKEHGFIIFMLCQLTPYYPDPLLDAPAESKSIHYNADMVLRIWKKHDQWVHPIYDEVPGNFVMDVRKNRNGESDQLIGFLFEEGARLTPNDSNVKTFKPKQGKDRTGAALERIADLLTVISGKDIL